MNSHLPVLIVGAGPTGLMMACELARRGVLFRIIDKNPERTLSSNATWIQTLTLEILDHMGIADRFLKLGQPCSAINLYVEGKSLVTIPLNKVDSPYPFVLMLPQSETERLLTEHLNYFNIQIERSSELIDVKQSNHSVISTVQHANGSSEMITSDWLIACDGSNSSVREKCHMFFPGEDLSEQFIVADAQIESFMSKHEIHVFFDQGTLFSAAPLGANNYRITANLHLDHPRKHFTEKEVIEMAQERAHGNYYVNKASWISSFWIHSKIVKNFRHESIFLAGDAAHVHAPTGGQGMNTGLQDAYNLAWKLALVINEKAKPTLLDSYQEERHPVVEELVNQTEQFTKMALFDADFIKKLKKFSEKLSRNEASLSKEIGRHITQLDIQYKNSPVIAKSEHLSAISPQPGERAPDVIINSAKRLYDYLRHPLHTVLLFTGLSATQPTLDNMDQLQQSLHQMYPELVKVHIIGQEASKGMNDMIIDVNDNIHERYHIKHPTIYVIRPDSYIALCSTKMDAVSIAHFLQRYLYE